MEDPKHINHSLLDRTSLAGHSNLNLEPEQLQQIGQTTSSLMYGVLEEDVHGNWIEYFQLVEGDAQDRAAAAVAVPFAPVSDSVVKWEAEDCRKAETAIPLEVKDPSAATTLSDTIPDGWGDLQIPTKVALGRFPFADASYRSFPQAAQDGRKVYNKRDRMTKLALRSLNAATIPELVAAASQKSRLSWLQRFDTRPLGADDTGDMDVVSDIMSQSDEDVADMGCFSPRSPHSSARLRFFWSFPSHLESCRTRQHHNTPLPSPPLPFHLQPLLSLPPSSIA